MKRIISLALALVLVLGTAILFAEPASAASEMTVSEDLIKVLKLEEGFIKYPSWDYGQYSIGYGTRCPDDMLVYYQENGITESEADLLLRNYVSNTANIVNTKLIDKNNLSFTQGQFDAVVSFSYNMGAGWISNSDQNIYQQIVNGATGNDLMDAFARWCNAGGEVQHFLVRRRLSEANMYLNGVYSRTIPSNFCYVTYDGNGGSVSHKVQAYDSNITAVPHATATYENYTFTGWYTAQVGGTKVEVLNGDYAGNMLYAHWAELESVTPEENPDPIRVTVNTDGVNLRKGPGTNYAVIGIADTGEQFDILQVRSSNGLKWGQYDGGWICLNYTDYDTVISGGTTPDATEPEATVPDTTVPETTVPETTEPAVTVTGTVNADPYLCVRQGPGTGYSTVDTLQTGETVTITEQKTVGSMIWGKIADGWISMSYVTLDSDTAENVQPSSGQTGTVTCYVLNVRSGAGISYGIASYYYKGDSVTITQTQTVGTTTWGKTSAGWISMDYVKLDSTASGDTDAEQGTATVIATGTVSSNDVLRIRSGAGTSYSIVGYLDPGTAVSITETKTVGSTTWGKVEKGWICMDYVTLDSSSDSTQDTEVSSVTKTVTVSCLCVRSGAGTDNSIVDYLYKGSKVEVTETTTVGTSQWGKIAQGWICLDYTE